jgi:hypothetical protein
MCGPPWTDISQKLFRFFFFIKQISGARIENVKRQKMDSIDSDMSLLWVRRVKLTFLSQRWPNCSQTVQWHISFVCIWTSLEAKRIHQYTNAVNSLIHVMLLIRVRRINIIFWATLAQYFQNHSITFFLLVHMNSRFGNSLNTIWQMCYKKHRKLRTFQKVSWQLHHNHSTSK